MYSTKARAIIRGAIFGTLFLGALPILAEDGPIRRTEEIREKIEARQGEIQENIETRQAEIGSTSETFKQEVEAFRSSLAQKLQERVYNLTTNIKRRMSAAVERLHAIADRMETRAEKIQETGTDVSVAQGHIADARRELGEASVILGQDLGSFAYKDAPGQKWREVKDKFSETKLHLRAARDNLQLALLALKGVPPSTESEVASSTESTITN